MWAHWKLTGWVCIPPCFMLVIIIHKVVEAKFSREQIQTRQSFRMTFCDWLRLWHIIKPSQVNKLWLRAQRAGNLSKTCGRLLWCAYVDNGIYATNVIKHRIGNSLFLTKILFIVSVHNFLLCAQDWETNI